MYKIKLIDSKFSKEKRIIKLFESIKKWLYTDELNYLVNLYNGNIDKNKNLKENMEYLSEFVNVWDFRSKIKGINERWNIESNTKPIVYDNLDKIFECLKNLNMVEKTIPEYNPDYILILGGARVANFKRPEYTKEIIDKLNIKKSNVIGLSTLREINDVERDNDYTSDIIYEYDAINKGIESYFNVSKYEEKINDNSNINIKSCVRKYNDKYNDNNIYSLASPSSDEDRRANSKDTFDFFLKEFDIKENSSLLLVTSGIYVNYQFLKFVDLALEKNYNIECVGYEMELKDADNINNYLQELKGTIDTIKVLYNKYSLYDIDDKKI